MMRKIGIAAIALAMAAPAAMAQPQGPVQSERQPGRYSTEWGEATVTFSDRGGATIKFADGSEIWGNFSVGGSGRFIGYWARARRAGGLQPAGTSWASRCDTSAAVLPAGFGDRRTPYWGTALVTFRRGEFTAYFNSCRGLPHSTGTQREGLHGRLLTRVSEYTPKIIDSGIGRDWILKSLREQRIPCGAQPQTVAFLSSCELALNASSRLIVQRDLQPGFHIRFTPLVSNAPAIGDALHNGRRPPVRPGAPSTRQGSSASTVLRRGATVGFRQTPEMCRSDPWLVEVVTARGGAYPHSGIFVSGCGPRDGTFRSSGPAK